MTPDYPMLRPLGWGPDRRDELPAGALPARVIRHDGHALLGATPAGTRALRAPAHTDPAPTVGDWVAVPADPVGSDPLAVIGVLPRRSLLRRLSADGLGAQALAANVDIVLITCGVDRPIRAGRIQRLAVQAWDCGATPVLVLTKVAEPERVDIPSLEIEHPGMQVLATAALEGEGLDALVDVVAGRTAVLVGESGAGKSTLANALLGRDTAAVGAVRDGDAKGRHTTTSRQLHPLPGPRGGALIDSPGIRSVGLATDADAIDAVFPDIEALAVGCRFSDCAHASEPGCAVRAAVEDGALAPGRLAGWQRLQREVASAALRATPHEFRAEARRFGKRAKQAMEQRRRDVPGR